MAAYITAADAHGIDVGCQPRRDDREGEQQYVAVQAKTDRAYEDRLAGRVSDDLRQRKSREWEQELAQIRRDTALHEGASHDCMAKGSEILELAQRRRLVLTQNPAD